MANDSPWVNIQNEGQVIKPVLKFEVGNVANPKLINPCQYDVLGQVIELSNPAAIGGARWFYRSRNTIAHGLELMLESITANTAVDNFVVYGAQGHLRMVAPNLANNNL